MTARTGGYCGPIIGTSTAIVGLTGGATQAPVNFDFAPAAVTPGALVTFSMSQVSPAPGGFVFYHVGTCGLGDANCATPSPFEETEGTTTPPPLNIFRRNGVSAIIFDTRPLPPPIQ